jgi:hypothetical protein
MAISETLQGGFEGGSHTALTETEAVTFTITDAARQTLYVAVTFDDQGDSSGRTITCRFAPTGQSGNSAYDMTEIRRNTQSGPFVAVFKRLDPYTAGAGFFTISSSAAFNSRQWRVIAWTVQDNDQTTPNDAPPTNAESASTTSSTLAVSSATTDRVYTVLAADGKTVAAVGINSPGTLLDERSGAGGVYLGAAVYAGATTVNTSWGNGSGSAWSGAAPAVEIAFNANEDTGGGGTTAQPGAGALTLTGTSLGLGFTINMPSEA